MSSYSIGAGFEYRYKVKLEKGGWFVIRTPKSKGGFTKSKLKPIDLVAIKDGKCKLFSLKFGKTSFSKAEIEELKKIKEIAKCPVILVSKKRFKPIVEKSI